MHERGKERERRSKERVGDIRLIYISEIFQELVSYSLVLDASCVVLVVVALHREVPIEIAGELGTTTSTGDEETSQVWKLDEKIRHN